ncbi:MAG: hypothetical protein ABEI53_02885 [Candidatus Magasanikbacteria bacterium]
MNFNFKQNQNCKECSDSSSWKMIGKAVLNLFRSSLFVTWILPLMLIFILLFISIPVLVIPGNSFQVQLQLYGIVDYLIIIVLSFLSSFLVISGIYRYKRRQKGVSSDGFGVVFSVIASVFGAPSCPMCLAALFSFLGFGAVSFVVKNQWIIFSAALLVVLLSLYNSLLKMPNTDHE